MLEVLHHVVAGAKPQADQCLAHRRGAGATESRTDDLERRRGDPRTRPCLSSARLLARVVAVTNDIYTCTQAGRWRASEDDLHVLDLLGKCLMNSIHVNGAFWMFVIGSPDRFQSCLVPGSAIGTIPLDPVGDDGF